MPDIIPDDYQDWEDSDLDGVGDNSDACPETELAQDEQLYFNGGCSSEQYLTKFDDHNSIHEAKSFVDRTSGSMFLNPISIHQFDQSYHSFGLLLVTCWRFFVRRPYCK